MVNTRSLEQELKTIFVTICEMLTDRGRTTDEAEFALEKSIHRLEGASSHASTFTYDFDSCKTRVIFHLVQKVKVPEVMANRREDEGWQNIVVVREKPVQNLVKGLETSDRRMQLFTTKELRVNITHHNLVPKHTPMRTDAEISKIMSQFNLRSITQLPIIVFNDPVARYFALCSNEVVHIERASKSEGTSVYFRVCQ
jgi:DNA-directed RNA polymerase subunit H (RpoH/RPB5)